MADGFYLGSSVGGSRFFCMDLYLNWVSRKRLLFDIIFPPWDNCYEFPYVWLLVVGPGLAKYIGLDPSIYIYIFFLTIWAGMVQLTDIKQSFKLIKVLTPWYSNKVWLFAFIRHCHELSHNEQMGRGSFSNTIGSIYPCLFLLVKYDSFSITF